MQQGVVTEPECLVTNQHGDRYLFSVNRGTFNQLGATAYFQRHFAQQFSRENTFYLIFGSDSGLLLQFILQQTPAAGSRYLLVELDEVCTILNQAGHLPDHPQIKLCTQQQWQAAANAFNIEDYITLDQVISIKSLAALDTFNPAYHHLVEAVQQSFYHLSWRAKVNFSGYLFIETQLANIAENVVPAQCLTGTFQGATAVLLGGGPSLDTILPQLMSCRQALLIVAVSRIAKRLLDVGLIPDIIVAIDPTEKMFHVSKDMNAMGQTLFVNAFHVTPLLCHAWQGPQVYLGPRVPWQSRLNVENIDVVGPTVTNAALHFMLELGCQQILLAGVDLCYSQEGFSHAQGSAEHQAGPRLGFMGQTVSLYNGGTGVTEPAFFTAIKQLAEQAGHAQQRQCRLINLSASAAKIEHIDHIPLAAISYQPLTQSPATRIAQALSRSPVKYSKADIKQCSQDIRRVQQRLHSIYDLASQGRKLNQTWSAKNARQQSITRLNNIDRQLKQNFGDLLTAIKYHSYQLFLDVFRPTQNEQLSNEEIQAGTEAYLKAYASGAKKLQHCLMQAQQRLQSRLLEQQADADCQQLFAQWRQDKQYARAFLWRQKFPEAYAQLDLEQRQAFDHLMACYQQQLQEKPQSSVLDFTDHEKFCLVRQRIYRSYVQQNAAELARLMTQLSAYPFTDSELLVLLAQGCRAELEQQYAEAAAQYHHAAQGANTELALNLLASLLVRLGDNDNALLTLECLCQISPGYIAQYDQLKALLSQTEVAE